MVYFLKNRVPVFVVHNALVHVKDMQKKIGDCIGTMLDGGDAPILIFSFGGVALTIAFGIWAVNNL